MKYIFPDSLLSIALEYGYLHIVQFLVCHGADVNSKNTKGTNRAPIHIAAEKGDLMVIEYLFSQGSDIFARDCFVICIFMVKLLSIFLQIWQ